LEFFIPAGIIIIKMKNTIKYCIIVALSVVIFEGCLDTQSVADEKSPLTMTIDSPKNGDSVVVGRNFMSYTAEDNPLGGGFSQFEVFLNGFSHKVFAVSVDSTSPKLYFDLDTSQLGKTVSIFVTAYNINGGIKTSEPVTGLKVKEDTSPPNPPDSLIAPYITPTSILLVWVDNATNETGYEVYRSAGNNTNYSLITTLPKNTISYADNNITSTITYYYKIRSINKYGFSTWSNEVGISSGGSTNPSDTPYDLAGEILGSTQLNLTWKLNTVSSLNGFEIQRMSGIATTFSPIKYLPASARSYLDQGLTASVDYSYRVVAIYSTKKTYSSSITLTTSYTDIPPPSNLTASFNATDSYISLTWANNTQQENGTYIERKDDFNDFKVIYITPSGTTSYSDSVFSQLNQNGLTYQYRVRQYTTENFFTSYSNTATAFIPFSRPIAPKNFAINEVIEGERYFLTWSYQAGAYDYFMVYVREGTGATYQEFKSTGLNYNLQGLVYGKIYGVKVRAFKNDMGGDYTTELMTPLLKPINLTATLSYFVTKPWVTLNWTNRATNADYIEIERRNVGDVNFTRLQTPIPITSIFLDSTVAIQSDYEYRIRAIRINTPPLSNSGYSNVVRIIIP